MSQTSTYPRLLVWLLASLAVLLVLPMSALAQEGTEYTNLQLLDDTMPRRELSDLMKGWSRALGVRCEFCHVGSEADGFDYALDDKKHKLMAREMLRMTLDINNKYLADFGGHGLEVTCETCHRGRKEPADLDEVLYEVLERDGLAAAMERYNTLRAEHFGGPAYDFRAGTLNRLAQRLTQEKKLDAAAAILALNLEHYDSAGIYFMLGEVHRKRDDKDAALDAYRKCLELDPESSAARVRLQEMEKK